MVVLRARISQFWASVPARCGRPVSLSARADLVCLLEMSGEGCWWCGKGVTPLPSRRAGQTRCRGMATAAELKATFGEPGAIGERTGAQLLEMRVLDVAVHTWDLAATDLGVGRAGEGGRAGQAHHDGAHAAGVHRDHALTRIRPRRACGQVRKGVNTPSG